MTPGERPPPLEPTSQQAAAAVPARRRWRSWAVWAAVILVATVAWPRRQRIALPNGSVLEVTQVSLGPRHTCPIPITVASIKAAIGRRSFRWPHFETFGEKNTIGIWFDRPNRSRDDALYLVDRSGWSWAPLMNSRESPILFPPIDHRPPVCVAAVARRQPSARSPLAIPARTPPRNDWQPDTLPVRRTDGPLDFELKDFEVVVAEKIPSEASVRLKMEMTWNGHPFCPHLVSPSLVDTRRREDDPEIAPDGRFITHLSPYDTLWQLQFLVGRDREQLLEADEEIVFEPDWEDADQVRIWDQTVAGIRCRFAVSRGSDKIVVPSLRSGTETSWRALGTKVVAEPEHGSGASVRIDFLDLDGHVIHRGIVDKLVVTSHLPGRRTTGAYGSNSGAINLPDRYRIRVGIDVPCPVMLTLRPVVVVPTREGL